MTKRVCCGVTLLASCIVIAACESTAVDASASAGETSTSTEIYAEVWADNWFALYAHGELVIEDSEPVSQERSFNVEAFNFSADKNEQMAVVMKDYKETDSGLEYIGKRRQQVGDGGFIAQFYDAASRELIAVSSSEWLCTVIHQAPLNLDCERSSDPDQECRSNVLPEPEGWRLGSFDDSQWKPAIEHSSQAVRPHGGYSRYTWEESAKIIWSEDLEIDNTVLCRFSLD